jgi:hypothetical protein
MFSCTPQSEMKNEVRRIAPSTAMHGNSTTFFKGPALEESSVVLISLASYVSNESNLITSLTI